MNLGNCTRIMYDLFGFMLRSYLKLDYRTIEMHSMNFFDTKMEGNNRCDYW